MLADRMPKVAPRSSGRTALPRRTSSGPTRRTARRPNLPPMPGPPPHWRASRPGRPRCPTPTRPCRCPARPRPPPGQGAGPSRSRPPLTGLHNSPASRPDQPESMGEHPDATNRKFGGIGGRRWEGSRVPSESLASIPWHERAAKLPPLKELRISPPLGREKSRRVGGIIGGEPARGSSKLTRTTRSCSEYQSSPVKSVPNGVLGRGTTSRSLSHG